MDAVLWESLTEATHDESRLTVTYLAFLIVATMIAACGVLLDSAILIVGAMVVGPEFGPLAGVCTALVRRRPRLALRPLNALVVGFPLAMLATGVFSLLMDALGLFSKEKYQQPHPVSEFVWQPDLMSFVVARTGGHRRDPLPDLGEVRCPGGRRHLGDDGACRGQRGPGRQLRRSGRDDRAPCSSSPSTSAASSIAGTLTLHGPEAVLVLEAQACAVAAHRQSRVTRSAPSTGDP